MPASLKKAGTAPLKGAAARACDEAVTVTVAPSGAVGFGFEGLDEELSPLFFRRAEYRLPTELVSAPMPTTTVRHLEKATAQRLNGHEEQALLAFRRAVASAVEPGSLIKVALACHTENFAIEAQQALARALKHAGADERAERLVRAIAQHFGYAI